MNGTRPPAGLIDRFIAITGPDHALTEPADQAPYLREWRDLYVGETPLVLRPGTVDEVSKIVALASETGTAIVPQGGNTGLVGGQIPIGANQLVLSLTRLRSIRNVDAEGGTMTVDAGVTLADVQSAADDAGRLFPLSLASEGSCQVGGVLATNAGGVAVLAYGNARNLCLGLEVVLADGRIWTGLRGLKKDNTGYDLRDLFIGSEGTLGIITAATLKLLPKPAGQAVAVAALTDPAQALTLFRLAEQRGRGDLTAFELWCRRAQDFALSYIPGTRDPFSASHPWYVLIEVSSGTSEDAARSLLEDLLGDALTGGLIDDAVMAASIHQARDFWKLRESMSEAQKGAGGSIKHDISVPVAAIPEFLLRAALEVERICPGARPVPFGHFGDGNLHYNVSQPIEMARADYLKLWPSMSGAIHALVDEMRGSISAEHGIGQLKRQDLQTFKGAVELDLMRGIKRAFDPFNILNPGKVL